MDLDLTVSQMVSRATLLEAALHSQATWYVEIGGVRREAVRHVHERGVTFRACFPPSMTGAEYMDLSEGDEVRASRLVGVPLDEQFCIAFDISVEEPIPA